MHLVPVAVRDARRGRWRCRRSATPAASRRRSRTASWTSASSAGCAVSNCPYAPGLHELAIDFPRLMARVRAMRHSTGQRTIRTMVADQLFGRTDLVGKVATRAAPAINRVVGVEAGTLRRRVLAQVTGVTAQRRLAPFARRRFSRSLRKRARRSGPAAERRVTVFPTCLVEYRRPEIGHALLDVYGRHGIACEVARLGCCGAPWLTAGDTERFAAHAARNVASARRCDSRRHRRRRRPTDLPCGDHHRLHRSCRRCRRRTGRRQDVRRRRLPRRPRGRPIEHAGSTLGSRVRARGGAPHRPPRTVRPPRRRDPLASPPAARADRSNGHRRVPMHGRRRQMGAARRQRTGSVSPSPRSSAPRSDEQHPTQQPDMVTGTCVLTNIAIEEQIGRDRDPSFRAARRPPIGGRPARTTTDNSEMRHIGVAHLTVGHRVKFLWR